MNYLKAIALPNKPFIQWDLYASSYEELVALGLNADPLIMAEENVPEYIYNVCPLKIVAGQLENRTPAEMAAFEAEYNDTEQPIRNYRSKVEALATEHFTWGGYDFPMYEIARLLYSCIQYAPGNNYKVLDVTGVQRTLLNSDTAAFINAYYVKLTSLTQP